MLFCSVTNHHTPPHFVRGIAIAIFLWKVILFFCSFDISNFKQGDLYGKYFYNPSVDSERFIRQP